MRHCKVTKGFEFEAAHFLPAHFGKCARLHGHSYKLEATLSGMIQEVRDPHQSSDGMVLDFYHLSNLVKTTILEIFDHRNLNEVLPEDFHPTTAENIAWFIFHALFKPLESDAFHLESIKLWETASGYVEVERGDYLRWQRS